MPIIARFYGIVIRMYSREHGVAHFHAAYGEYSGVFALDTLTLIEGNLPRRAQKMVREWAVQNQSELLEIWETQRFKHLPGLD